MGISQGGERSRWRQGDEGIGECVSQDAAAVREKNCKCVKVGIGQGGGRVMRAQVSA